MSGVKGRSGRKSSVDEERRAKVINKAWQKAERILDGEEFKNQTTSLIQAIVVKTIPEQLEHSGDVIINYGHRMSSGSLRNEEREAKSSESDTEARP